MGFQDVSLVLHDSFLACVDFQDMQKEKNIEWNLGNQVIVRIINPQLPTLDINLINFVLLPSFLESTLCQLPSTCTRSQHMLKMSHGVLGKHPGNPFQHVCFISYPPKCISSFFEKMPVLLRFKAKGKARLGVVEFFFATSSSLILS